MDPVLSFGEIECVSRRAVLQLPETQESKPDDPKTREVYSNGIEFSAVKDALDKV